MNKKTEFPEEPIRHMLHALGISHHPRTNNYVQPNTRYNPYPTSYRNYYQIKQCEIWDELVKKEYASKHRNGLGLDFYVVTSKGKQYLRDLGYKWHERDK